MTFRPALCACLVLLAPGARAAFAKGGLVEVSPRTAALGGADVAAPGGEADGPVAGLAGLAAPRVAGGWGMAGGADLRAFRVAAAAPVEGLGVAASLCRLAAGAAGWESCVGLGVGVPVAEAPGTGFGARVKFLQGRLGAEHGVGAGLDLGAQGPLPDLPGGVTPRWAVSLEDALGGVRWSSGAREDLARQGRLGVAATWRAVTGLAEGRLVRGPGGRENIWALGAEYRFALHGVGIALRTGWRDGAAREGTVSGGLAAGWGPVRVEYAVTGATRSQGTLHALALAWLPGGDAAGEAPSARGGRAAVTGRATPERGVWRPSNRYEGLAFLLAAPHGARGTSWSAIVEDETGRVVWSADGDGAPPGRVVWNGTTADGEPAPAGQYASRLILQGGGSARYVSRPSPFALERPAAAPAPADAEGPGGF